MVRVLWFSGDELMISFAHKRASEMSIERLDAAASRAGKSPEIKTRLSIRVKLLSYAAKQLTGGFVSQLTSLWAQTIHKIIKIAQGA